MLRLISIGTVAVNYCKTLLDCVNIEKWKVWSTGSAIYVRLVVVIKDGDYKATRVVVLQFTRTGFKLVPDYDPRNEVLEGDES